MTWAGANNIEPGVTIDLSLMNSTIYNKQAKVASVLPGARWQSVYKTLEAYNVAVPGGRTGPVGVGGFLLGGEIRYRVLRMEGTKKLQVVTPSMARASVLPATT
jgi:FAD/FMN-containing dehydrogenase